jgi:ABC-type lipoprotein export system ATPase subunit
MSILESTKVQNLARIVEESTRSTKEGVKYFIEPAPGTLGRAKNKRHHIIFGRRGSGKSSLLAKVTADLTVNRSPIAYVDLEEFKGHSYPDVLLSVLIKTKRRSC